MKKKKMIKITLTSLAAIFLLLILLVLFWLGPTVKLIAESVGSKALGTPLTIESLSINPRKGTLDLQTFQLNTHDGFVHTNTFRVADIQIAINMRSLFSDTIVIPKIQINSPHLTYEQSPDTDNLTELIASLETFTRVDPNAAPEKPEPTPEDDAKKKPKQIIIEQLVINDVQLHLANTAEPQLDIQLALEQLSLSLTNGIVQLKNLTLSNPARLATPNVFELAAINIQLDPSTLYADNVVINDIQVIRPHAFLEQNPQANTVGEFIKIAKALSPKTEAPQTAQVASTATATTKAPPPVELHQLLVDDIQVKLLDTTGTNAQIQTLAAISNITVKLLEGTIRIQDITLPNPNGFTATNLFHLAHIDIILDPDTLYTPQVIINQVLVDTLQVNLEQTETAGNVAELQKMLKSFIPPAPATTASQPIATPAADPIPLAEQPVLLHTLLVTNLAVNMITPAETNLLSETFSLGTLGNMNPIKLLGNSSTNAPSETKAADGPLTLLSFDQLSVEPLKGLIKLDNLQVGNPKGFANKNIVQLDRFQLNIDPDTLQADVMLIQEILIDNPTIAYERKLTHDNIKALQIFIENTTQQREENLKEDVEEAKIEEPEEKAESQKVIINHLLVNSGLVKAKLSALPSAPIPLPKIEMNGIGKEKGGTSKTEAVTQIGTKFYDTIIGSVSSTTGFATDALKGLGALAMGPDGKPLPEITETNITTTVTAPTPKPTKKKRRRPGRAF